MTRGGQERSHPGSMKLSSSSQPGSEEREREREREMVSVSHSLRPGLVVVTEKRGQTGSYLSSLSFLIKIFLPLTASLGRTSAENIREHLNRGQPHSTHLKTKDFFSVQFIVLTVLRLLLDYVGVSVCVES